MKEFRQAASDGNLEELKRLVETGQVLDLNEAGKDSGKTALHWAAQKGHLEVVQFLVGLKGLKIDALDKDGNSPFNLVAQPSQASLAQKLLVIECLLNNHADPILPNKTGKTPFNNMSTYIRDQGTQNQKDFFRVQVQKIKDIVSEKALVLQKSAAIRRDGTVVFGESEDLVSNPLNLATKISILGFANSTASTINPS